MKTIIQVWTHKCVNHIQNNVDGFWGLGDMIRGTIKLYQLCKKYNYNYIVDIRLHSISNFLNQMENPHSQLILDNKNNIEFVYPGGVENYINIRENYEIIYFFTNDHCDENIDEDTKIFMRNLLSQNIHFNSYFNSKINQIFYENYNIMHFRFGDNELVRGNNTNLNKYLNIFLNNKENNDILICDSITFKNEVKNITNTFTFDTNPIHIGYSKDLELLQDTLVDFFIMINSKKIKTCSVYGWISGFTFWISKIYNIPLINMNVETEVINKQKIYFHTFANEKFYGALKRIRKQVDQFNIFNAVFIYNDNELKKDTEFWDKHKNFILNNSKGYGYWIWKSYLTLKTLEKINENDILIYSDSGCEWNIHGKKRLEEYINILNSNKKDILSFQLNHLEKSWTKMDLINYLNSYNMLNTKQIHATIFMIKKTHTSINIVKEWYDTSCNYNLIDDNNNNLNEPEFKEHRHDQSVFSLLCKKYNSIILDDETYHWPWDIKDNYINYPILAVRNCREESIIDFNI
jgi:hypothetical protein